MKKGLSHILAATASVSLFLAACGGATTTAALADSPLALRAPGTSRGTGLNQLACLRISLTISKLSILPLPATAFRSVSVPQLTCRES